MQRYMHVSMCACIIYVCMNVNMYGGKNPYVFIYVGKLV